MSIPVSPTPPRRRPWLPWVIAAGAIVLVGALGAGVFFGVRAFLEANRRFAAPEQPLLEGPAQSPAAADPLACDPARFDESAIEALILPAEAFEALGITRTQYPYGTFDPGTAGELVRQALPGWESMGASPDSCFFVPGNSPLAASIESADPQSEDLIAFIQTWANTSDSESADESVRIFPDSESAVAYLAELAGEVDDCDRVSIRNTETSYSATVSAPSALELPSDVAAIGWVREGDPGPRWRAYVWDLQRGNLVLRVRILTDGSIAEADAREFAEGAAELLSALPAGG